MTTETTNEQQEQPRVTQLSINDLFVVREIITLCSTRGAFKAQELATVGTVFNKLDAFLKAIEEQQAAQAEAEVEAAGEEVTTEGDE